MRRFLVVSTRFLIIVFAISWCGLITADPRHTAIASSAVTRISLTILPRVEVERVHHVTLESSEHMAVTHTDALCLSSVGTTEYTVTTEGRTGIPLQLLPNSQGNCSNANSIAYGLDLPVDNPASEGFGEPLTVLVSAE